MNYSKTIENIKLTQLTAKESSEFVKRYEKPLLFPETQPISTETIVQETKEELDDDDESSISPVSLEAARVAEEAYKDYMAAEALEDAEEEEETYKPPISFDKVNTSPVELEDVISIPPSSTNPEIVQAKEPVLEEVTDTLIQPSSEPENANGENSETNSNKVITIKYDGQ
jgi:hypothetical protein